MIKRNWRANHYLRERVQMSGIVTLDEAFVILREHYVRITHRDCWRIFLDNKEWVYVDRAVYRRVE